MFKIRFPTTINYSWSYRLLQDSFTRELKNKNDYRFVVDSLSWVCLASVFLIFLRDENVVSKFSWVIATALPERWRLYDRTLSTWWMVRFRSRNLSRFVVLLTNGNKSTQIFSTWLLNESWFRIDGWKPVIFGKRRRSRDKSGFNLDQLIIFWSIVVNRDTILIKLWSNMLSSVKLRWNFHQILWLTWGRSLTKAWTSVNKRNRTWSLKLLIKFSNHRWFNDRFNSKIQKITSNQTGMSSDCVD